MKREKVSNDASQGLLKPVGVASSRPYFIGSRWDCVGVRIDQGEES